MARPRYKRSPPASEIGAKPQHERVAVKTVRVTETAIHILIIAVIIARQGLVADGDVEPPDPHPRGEREICPRIGIVVSGIEKTAKPDIKERRHLTRKNVISESGIDGDDDVKVLNRRPPGTLPRVRLRQKS